MSPRPCWSSHSCLTCAHSAHQDPLRRRHKRQVEHVEASRTKNCEGRLPLTLWGAFGMSFFIFFGTPTSVCTRCRTFLWLSCQGMYVCAPILYASELAPALRHQHLG
ncbi:hypothetical protein DFH06DRAFT_700251 [Mycena polygramma]|nr:hypothetical protein DFH06DRAFT_700251 [Mycena polygramma]